MKGKDTMGGEGSFAWSRLFEIKERQKVRICHSFGQLEFNGKGVYGEERKLNSRWTRSGSIVEKSNLC